jgi:hypothetical protein
MRSYSLLVALIAATFTLLSCSKEKNDPAVPSHTYAKEWDIESCTGPLGYFYVSLIMDNNQGGVVYTQYKATAQTYPIAPLTWNRMQKDSVRIEFAFDAYPDEKWEFRGLANDSSTHIYGKYFRVNKNDPSQRLDCGTFVITED